MNMIASVIAALDDESKEAKGVILYFYKYCVIINTARVQSIFVVTDTLVELTLTLSKVLQRLVYPEFLWFCASLCWGAAREYAKSDVYIKLMINKSSKTNEKYHRPLSFCLSYLSLDCSVIWQQSTYNSAVSLLQNPPRRFHSLKSPE